MARDFSTRTYVGPRIGDRLFLGFIIFSLYWHAAKTITPLKTPNIAAVLFMVSILPGFAATTYMPALILERPLYYRQALQTPSASADHSPSKPAQSPHP